MRRCLLAAVAVGAAVFTSGVGVPGAVAADGCPNAAVRAQQNAERLPECRGYELVSPPEKNGVDVQSDLKVSGDGNAVAWVSLGAYGDVQGANAEVPYVARRGGDGRWSTKSWFPRMDSFRPGLMSYLGAYAFSTDLSVMTVVTSGSFDPADLDVTVEPYGTFAKEDLYRTTGEGDATWVSRKTDGPTPNELIDVKLAGVSGDGSTAFFTTSEALSEQITAGTTISHVYRWRNGTTELVGVDENGDPFANGSALGSGSTSANPSTGNAGDLPDNEASSSDGQRFVYRGDPGSGLSRQLYLRRADGTVTRISSSQRAGSVGDPSPTGAGFIGSVGDLGIVYLVSQDQLTDDAPVGGGDYAYDTATGRLSFSNVDDRSVYGASGGGFIRASQDGRYVYFASMEVLAPGANAGDLNVYVRTPSGIRYVSPASVDDDALMIKKSLSVPSYSESSVSADGTRFVYVTVASAAGRDTQGKPQVYLYDDNATGAKVTCVSCDPSSSTATGEARLRSSSDYGRATPRTISADGSRVVFATQESLVDADTNSDAVSPANGQDVYEWVDGKVHLISSGKSGARASVVDMTADGKDVYFSTRSSLVPEDVDQGLRDIYDARVGGGFAQSGGGSVCADDACQGPPSGLPGGSVIGSVTFAGVGDGAVPGEPGSGKVGASKTKAITGSSGMLKVTVPGAGRLKASGLGLVGTSRSVGKRSTVSVKVSLSAAGKRALAKSKKALKRTLRLTFTPKEGAGVSASVVVTFKPKTTHKSSAASVVGADGKGGR